MSAVGLVWAAFLVETGLLFCAALLLLYPLVTHARNVLYTRGIVLLAAGLVSLTVGAMIEDLHYHLGVFGARPIHLVSYALYAASSAALALAVRSFARSPPEHPPPDSTTDAGGGFGDDGG